MERDEESGLNYHGARYLSFGFSRWISPDASGLSDGVNVWSYAQSNPVCFKDVKGRAAVPFPAPVAPVARIAAAVVSWFNEPSPMEKRIAESNAREAQRLARQSDLLKRDPNSLTFGEALEAGYVRTNEPTYGQDPFNQQFTTSTLSVLSINALAPVIVTAGPAMVEVSGGFSAVQLAKAPNYVEAAITAKSLSESRPTPMVGTATDPEPIIFQRDYPARSLADMEQIAKLAGVKMHPDMKLIVNDRMVDVLAKRVGADPKQTSAAYAPQSLKTGHVGFEDLLAEVNGEEFIPVYIRERLLSSDEEFIATVTHESHELFGLEAGAPIGSRMPPKKFQTLINSLHEEALRAEREAICKLRSNDRLSE
jgi:RHS repeat-associated protein